MKTTVVPAQVTTIEDRIMGNLGFSQLMLVILPVFIGAGLFVLLPPFMSDGQYKYVVMGIVAVTCCLLAVRIKGKIVALWLVMILRYTLRPRFYVFDKNTTAGREHYNNRAADLSEEQTHPSATPSVRTSRLKFHDVAKVYAAIDNPASNTRFETTKTGGLHVRLTEIEK